MMTVLYDPNAPADAHLIARYDGRAPRYTSYPTAVQFTPEVTEATYRGWLAALPTDEAVSLYLHIPFCERLCWYCGCNTRAVNQHNPIREYVNLLMRELHLLQGALPGRLPVKAVHLGGGTPNMLSVEELAIIFDGLRRVFHFEAGAEIAAVTLEGVPVRAVRLVNDVPLGHKVAMRDIPSGKDVIEYGRVIGSASQHSPVGSHVHTHSVKTKRWS